MRITIIIILFLNIGACSKIKEENASSFSESFNKQKEYVIKIQYDPSPINIIRLFHDGTILIANATKNKAVRFNLKGVLITSFSSNSGISLNSDFALDYYGNIYHLNPLKKIIEKYRPDGTFAKFFRVLDGQKICITKSNKIFIYKTFYNIDYDLHAPTIYIYTLNGKYVKSFGLPPRKANIDRLPFSGGSISCYKGKIVVCHSSDYIVSVYNENGNFIKTYDKKPSFYYKLNEFKGLFNPYISNWYKTTELISSYFLNDNTLLAYFMKVNKSKSWFFIKNENKTLEIPIPPNLRFIGINKRSLIFIIQTEQLKNKEPILTKFVSYEFKKNI